MEGEWRLADRVPARLSAAEGRKFGLVVGGAFLVFGTISYLRGHVLPPQIMGGLGGLLVLGGLIAPQALSPIHAAWMKLAEVLSKVTTPVFMGVVYFVVLTPTGLLMRLFGRNSLVRKPVNGSYWVARGPAKPKESLRQQY